MQWFGKYLGSVVQTSPIPTSLPEPLTASDIAAKKSQTKARYLKQYTMFIKYFNQFCKFCYKQTNKSTATEIDKKNHTHAVVLYVMSNNKSECFTIMMNSIVLSLCLILCRITDSVGPTETSIAPRQRPKAANSNVLPLPNSVTPVKMSAPPETVSNGQNRMSLLSLFLVTSVQNPYCPPFTSIYIYIYIVPYAQPTKFSKYQTFSTTCIIKTRLCIKLLLSVCDCVCACISPRKRAAGSCADAEQQPAQPSVTAATAWGPETAAAPSSTATTTA